MTTRSARSANWPGRGPVPACWLGGRPAPAGRPATRSPPYGPAPPALAGTTRSSCAGGRGGYTGSQDADRADRLEAGRLIDRGHQTRSSAGCGSRTRANPPAHPAVRCGRRGDGLDVLGQAPRTGGRDLGPPVQHSNRWRPGPPMPGRPSTAVAPPRNPADPAAPGHGAATYMPRRRRPVCGPRPGRPTRLALHLACRALSDSGQM